jgi:hypothetical protein
MPPSFMNSLNENTLSERFMPEESHSQILKEIGLAWLWGGLGVA